MIAQLIFTRRGGNRVTIATLCWLSLSLFLWVWVAEASGQPTVDAVLVMKARRTMYLLNNGEVVRSYKIRLGGNPRGHKEQEGDQRTPEGVYLLDYKKQDSAFYRAIHISYPNDDDLQRATAKNINPGGQIMIHGQRNGLEEYTWLVQRFDWTDGCIAVSNQEMEEIWNLVEVNTPIMIEQ